MFRALAALKINHLGAAKPAVVKGEQRIFHVFDADD